MLSSHGVITTNDEYAAAHRFTTVRRPSYESIRLGNLLRWLPRYGHDHAVITSSRPALDATAKAIVEQLQEDGRRPYAVIGQAVGLSEAAVRQRVQRLVEAGVMQIVAVTDPLQVGFPRQAMIGVHVDGDTRAVAQGLAAIDEVDYVVSTAGGFDVLAEVVCEDDEHLLDVLNSKIRTLAGVRSTETFVYLKLHKQQYDWGTR